MSYDDNNVFARIIRGEIPCDKVYEDDQVIAFNDINPQAPVHVLVCPKGAYVDYDGLAHDAKDEDILSLVRRAGQIARELGLKDGGYRLIVNCGPDSNQEVPHLHIHILGGRPLGPMLAG